MLDIEQLYDEVGANYDLDATRESAPFGHRTNSTRECARSESIRLLSCDLCDSESLGEEAGRARFERLTPCTRRTRALGR
jgi:hypothetical protein